MKTVALKPSSDRLPQAILTTVTFWTFSLTDGNTGEAFAIEPATGEITVNNREALDFETSPTFHLTVTVTDAAGLSDDAVVVVELNDVIPLDGIQKVIDELVKLKREGVLTNGEANPPINFLRQAQQAIGQGHASVAIQRLHKAGDWIQALIDEDELDPSLGLPLLETLNKVIAELESGQLLPALGSTSTSPRGDLFGGERAKTVESRIDEPDPANGDPIWPRLVDRFFAGER